MYENWLLAKGFQDLLRGVRESLEEAYLFVTLVRSLPQGLIKRQAFEEAVETARKRASGFQFPLLLSKVNAELREPMAFEREFLSMQKVRNCLEHRSGVVGPQDLDEDGEQTTLSFPALNVFRRLDDDEVLVTAGMTIEAGGLIFFHYTTRSKTYKLGDRVEVTAADFSDVAMACSVFGGELASKLPVIGRR